MLMSDVLHNGSVVTETEEQQSAGVTLKAIIDSTPVREVVPTAPTQDLIKLAKGSDLKFPDNVKVGGYFVWCGDTKETWYAPNTQVLDDNFLFRGDLTIIEITNLPEAMKEVLKLNEGLYPGEVTRKSCYVLDNPSIEKYEVFYDPAYVMQRYGTCSPKGTCVLRYKDRFARDVDILKLDKKYTTTSAIEANRVVSELLDHKQAIIVSDGALANNNISSAFVYIDDFGVVKQSESRMPSDASQGVIIAEIRGAYNALSLCYSRRKTDITYYYDNTAIVNILSNTKNNSIPEVRKYRELCAKMDAAGYRINFVDVHPKRGDHTADNKAILFLHNLCDSACSEMLDLFNKNYAGHAAQNKADGRTYNSIKKKGGRN